MDGLRQVRAAGLYFGEGDSVKNRDAKVAYLYRHQDGKCAISGACIPLLSGLTEIHHAHCHDTKNNRRQFPILIDSAWNLELVSKFEHEKDRSHGIWSYERCARAEAFMRRHPRIARWANNPCKNLWID